MRTNKDIINDEIFRSIYNKLERIKQDKRANTAPFPISLLPLSLARQYGIFIYQRAITKYLGSNSSVQDSFSFAIAFCVFILRLESTGYYYGI